MPKPIERIDSDIQAALDAPSMSDWLHNALLSALQRDCVDAACDAQILAVWLARRRDAVVGSSVASVG